MLCFIVQDTGPGIKQEEQQHIFDSFSQSESGRKSTYRGTGLGLTIAQQLAELMHGDIVLDSTEGVGSTFTFTGRFENSTLTTEDININIEHLNGIKTIIVDDNAASRDVLSFELDKLGLRSQCAESAEQALVIMRTAIETNDPFKIVILDFNMPETNGVALAEIIIKTPEFGQPRLLLLSSETPGSEELKREYFSCIIEKPVRQKDLLHCLASNCDQVEKAQDIPMSSEKNIEKKTDGTIMAKILLAEDNELNQQIVLLSLSDLGYSIVWLTMDWKQ